MNSLKEKMMKQSPKYWIELAFTVTCLILAAIVVFSLYGVDETKITDDSTKTKVRDSRNSTIGLVVMLGLLLVYKGMSKITQSSPKQFLRYF
jgi:hypothetical protein